MMIFKSFFAIIFLSIWPAFSFSMSNSPEEMAALAPYLAEYHPSREISRNATGIEKIDEGLFVAQKSESLFFVFERVDPTSRIFWQDYVINQLKIRGDLLDSPKYERYANVIGDSSDPLGLMNKYLRYSNKAEVWVAYARKSRPTGRYKKEEMSHIEMAMTVLTRDDAPFQLHMGISRGLAFIEAENAQHQGLATALHGFAAKTMLLLHPEKRFMITTPLPMMADILTKALPTWAVAKGHNQERSLILQEGEWPSLHFILKDHDGTKIFESNNVDHHYWFFYHVADTHPYVVIDLGALARLY